MVNVFKIKKYAAILLPSFLSAIGLIIGLKIYGFLIGLAIYLVILLVSLLFSSLLLKNPFTQMMEGKGLLTIELTSTGIINMFLCQIREPYIVNDKKGVSDIFDREIVYNLSEPTKAEGTLIKESDGNLTINLTKEDFNRARFGLFHYPVLIWNSQIKSFLTKDMLSDKEKTAFAEHSILYQNQKIAELSSAVRDFGRYIVELTKPATNILQSKWTWIIVVVCFVIIAALFAPSIFNAIKGGMSNGVSSVVSSVQPSGNLITPR